MERSGLATKEDDVEYTGEFSASKDECLLTLCVFNYQIQDFDS